MNPKQNNPHLVQPQEPRQMRNQITCTLGSPIGNRAGEDLDIRRSAVEALGPYNGSVVVVDSSNGRVLTMVNQKVALGEGFQPCSTVKVSVALAALSE